MCERPRRCSWWRSSRRAAREPPWMVRARQKHALRAHVMPGGEWLPLCVRYVRPFRLPRGPLRFDAYITAVGHGWDLEMRIPWASAVAGSVPGVGMQDLAAALWVRGRACLRVREHVPCRATAVVLVVHFARPSHGQILHVGRSRVHCRASACALWCFGHVELIYF